MIFQKSVERLHTYPDIIFNIFILRDTQVSFVECLIIKWCTGPTNTRSMNLSYLRNHNSAWEKIFSVHSKATQAAALLDLRDAE